MTRTKCTFLIVLWAGVAAALAAGCAEKRGTDMNSAVARSEPPPPAADAKRESAATPAAAQEKPAEAPPADKAAADKAAAKAAKEEAEKLEKETEQRQITRARLAREMAIAKERLSQSKLSMDHARIATDQSVAKAEKELEIARQKFDTFANRSVPNRLKGADLNFQYAQDGLTEAQEELAQLEMMYKEEEFADKTKEIVLSRGKRRLERSKVSLAIQTEELGILKERTIPVETTEQKIAVEDKEKALAGAKRDAESTMLDKRIGVMSAESEITRIETEQSSLEKEEQRAQKAAAEKAAEKAAAK